MGFKKGTKKTGGRQPGSQNKFTKQFKDLLAETYMTLEKGANKPEAERTGMLHWAKNNQTEFYKICSRLMPVQVTGEGGEPIEIRASWIAPSTQAKSKS